jgi:hypothetical protein
MPLLLVALLTALPLPKVEPIPTWVTPVEAPTKTTDDTATPLLLNDEQIRVEKTVEYFERRVWLARTLSGVESLAQHEFEWDPASEKMVLHGVWIWRDGKRRQAWSPDDARVFQREAQLDMGIYDGRLTFRVELRDLRVGDLVEVASTRSGENSVFKNHFSTSGVQADDFRMGLTHFRLLWNRGAMLQYKTHANAVEPKTSTLGEYKVFEWNLTDTPALHFEAEVPVDVEVLPYVEFTDWSSWYEVNEWAQTLFVEPKPNGRFKEELATILGKPESERVKAAVRFVQDDIRYVGIELAEHSHLPHSPAWVLERGFGDCKDKTLLLVSLLRQLNLKAWPVLVHSQYGLRLPNVLPSALEFNHAIVRIDFASGSRFVDATQTQRRGDPAQWESPQYGYALVIKPETRTLEKMPPIKSTHSTWEIHQKWKVPKDKEVGTLEIETVASAHEAATLRSHISSQSVSELSEKKRKTREDELHVKLKSTGFEFDDDETGERFTLREKYAVSDFLDAKDSHEFVALQLKEDLLLPPKEERKEPLAQPHPLRTKETIEYDADSTLSIVDFEFENKKVSHRAFDFAVKQEITKKGIFRIEWNLVTRADRIEVDEIESYSQAVTDSHEVLGYVVRPKEFHEASAVVASEPSIEEPKKEPPSYTWLYTLALVFLAVMVVVLVSIPSASSDKRSMLARLRTPAFQKKQTAALGELPTAPLLLKELGEAQVHFRTASCPLGHPWISPVAITDAIRMGDARIHVIGRSCSTCGASEHRYAKLS